MKALHFADLQAGQEFDFGSLSFTAHEIMEFAKVYDPIPWHTSAQAAAQGPFGGLIASGPHPFHAIYLREWIPRFAHSVLAGKGISNWNMLLPLRPDQVLHCKAKVQSCSARPEKGYGKVEWYFSFYSTDQTLVQELTMVVLHMLSPTAQTPT
jgi:acyl dehydratase